MQGRVCVITGASSGIGRAVAMGLARMDASVVLVCRNRERAVATQTAIREATGNKTVDFLLADLSAQAEIRRLAQELLARYPQIHVLINNAGVINWNRATTADGVETVFAVNHLAYFLLTNLLLDRMAASASARIVNVASDAHTWSPSHLDDLQSERQYKPFRVYGQSKLCNILFTRELARRLTGTKVTANAVHPGGVATGLGRNNGWWANLIALTLKPFMLSPERGADTVLYLAASADIDGVNGKYFAKRRETQPSRLALNDEEARRLWRVSAELAKLTV